MKGVRGTARPSHIRSADVRVQPTQHAARRRRTRRAAGPSRRQSAPGGVRLRPPAEGAPRAEAERPLANEIVFAVSHRDDDVGRAAGPGHAVAAQPPRWPSSARSGQAGACEPGRRTERGAAAEATPSGSARRCRTELADCKRHGKALGRMERSALEGGLLLAPRAASSASSCRVRSSSVWPACARECQLDRRHALAGAAARRRSRCAPPRACVAACRRCAAAAPLTAGALRCVRERVAASARGSGRARLRSPPEPQP